MEQVRLILAIASFAIGALIAIRTLFRRTSFTPRYPALGFLYSSLFVVAGLWLLQRSSVPEFTQRSPSEVSPDRPLQTETRTKFQQPAISPKPDTAHETSRPIISRESESLPDELTTSEAPIRRSSGAPWNRQPEFSAPGIDNYKPDFSAAKSRKARKAEDLVEDAVISAFDWIEFFFSRYGTASLSSPAAHGSQSSTTSTAKIQFVKGSSELDPGSASLVRAMAPSLASKFPNGSLVVRAAADDEGSNPALRNLLAQARAQTICDILSSGGFPANRLTTGVIEDSPTIASVEFVHRP